MGVLKLLLGTPDPSFDDAQTTFARKLFDEHKNEESLHSWPRHCGMERRILHRLIKSHKPSAAVRMIDEPLKRLWISALQSRVFNEVLSRRLATFDQVLPGDFAWKHDNGACFLVEDAAAEQPRAEAFEISPTGPLLGYRMSTPDRRAAQIEQEVLAQFQLTPEQFRLEGKHKVKGARRSLRIQSRTVPHRRRRRLRPPHHPRLYPPLRHFRHHPPPRSDERRAGRASVRTRRKVAEATDE